MALHEYLSVTVIIGLVVMMFVMFSFKVSENFFSYSAINENPSRVQEELTKTPSEEQMQSFIGQRATSVQNYLQQLYPHLLTVIVENNAIVTMEVNMKRIRLFQQKGIVVRKPKLG